MKKRILLYMLSLVIVSLAVTSALICLIFYDHLYGILKTEVRERALLLKDTAPNTADFISLSVSNMRLTVISANGAVIYDDDEEISSLPNHSDREEVIEALNTGAGESKRFSDTLSQETYYYAVLLPDGSVLRLAKTMSSIWGIYSKMIPIVILVVLVICIASYTLAGYLTKMIVDPINKVDLNTSKKLTVPYDELTPFLKTIGEQRSEIEKQMESLKERTNTIETIMESMNEGIVMVNRKGVILTVNKSIKSFFDVPNDAVGKNYQEYFRDIDLIENMRGALEGKRRETDFENGGRIFKVYFSPVSGSGVIILFMDISEKAKAETIRREFSANVSHELKTPLTTIYGNAEMLCGGMVIDKDKQLFYEKIKEEAGRMITLIDDIISLSKLDEDKGRDLYEEINISSVAVDAIKSLAKKASDNNIKVFLSGKEISIKANRSQIYELFYNLIDNAIKYNTPNGEVSVIIETEPQNNRIILSVSDTGIGIPKEAQERVFERFYRVDKSRSKQTGGTGLGLAIVKHIVKAYRGEIKLDSKPGHGTKITVYIPIC